MATPKQSRGGFYIQQDFPGDDFGVSKIEVMQACLDKFQYSIVRCNGTFAILEYHHGDTDAFAPIHHIIRPESARRPEELPDTAFGAAGSIGDRTNLGELSDEYVHEVHPCVSFLPDVSKHIGPLLD